MKDINFETMQALFTFLALKLHPFLRLRLYFRTPNLKIWQM